MTATKSAFELHLEKLKVVYLSQLPEKLNSIETDWNQLCSSWQAEIAVVLHRNVHSLIGTAGTFGFGELSRTARELEVMLKPLEGVSVDYKPNAELIDKVKTKIEQLININKADASNIAR